MAVSRRNAAAALVAWSVAGSVWAQKAMEKIAEKSTEKSIEKGAEKAGAYSVLVGNVPYPSELQLQGRALQLNGAGVRYKTVFEVYSAGLYLEKKAHTVQEVQAQGGPKRLHIVMLREIDSGELGRLFSRGMEDNMDKAAFSKLVPGVLRMSEIFATHKKLLPGEAFSIDWLPQTGTRITVKGQAQGEPFKEPEFFNALLGIWLGPQPADWKLKDLLLGQPAPGA